LKERYAVSFLVVVVLACLLGCSSRDVRSVRLPFGYLDTVKPGSELKSIVRLQGWALSEDGIAKVCFYIDRSQVGCSIDASLSRPDVAKVFPAIGSAGNSGYDIVFDTTTFPAGAHELTVQAVSKTGGTRDLASFPVILAE
jgi:uncharacterized membrane protein YtjA (UPF0391 family)